MDLLLEKINQYDFLLKKKETLKEQTYLIKKQEKIKYLEFVLFLTQSVFIACGLLIHFTSLSITFFNPTFLFFLSTFHIMTAFYFFSFINSNKWRNDKYVLTEFFSSYFTIIFAFFLLSSYADSAASTSFEMFNNVIYYLIENIVFPFGFLSIFVFSIFYAIFRKKDKKINKDAVLIENEVVEKEERKIREYFYNRELKIITLLKFKKEAKLNDIQNDYISNVINHKLEQEGFNNVEDYLVSNYQEEEDIVKIQND